MTAFKWLLQYRTSKKEKKKQRERACAFESGDCLTAELGFVRFTFVCASADGHFVMTSMTRRCFVDDERWLKELLNVVLSLHSCFNKDFFLSFYQNTTKHFTNWRFMYPAKNRFRNIFHQLATFCCEENVSLCNKQATTHEKATWHPQNAKSLHF